MAAQGQDLPRIEEVKPLPDGDVTWVVRQRGTGDQL